jgi:hypothetical protein
MSLWQKMSYRMPSSRAEPENDPGTIPEVILPVACTIRDFCQEVFGLDGANREVFGDIEINAPSRSHREGVQGRVVDAPGSPEQVGENSPAEAIAGVLAAQVSYYPEPIIDIVSELATKGILRKVNKLALTALRLAASRKESLAGESILLDATTEALL